MKRILLLLSLTSATVSLHGQGQPRIHVNPRRRQPFSVVEATIPEMQAAMKQGRVTSRGLVVQYSIRIARFNRRLNGVITVNPRALQEADARDRERTQGKVRGPCTEFQSPSKTTFRRRRCRRRAGHWRLTRSYRRTRRHSLRTFGTQGNNHRQDNHGRNSPAGSRAGPLRCRAGTTRWSDSA